MSSGQQSVTALKKFTNFTNWFDELLLNAKIADNRYPVKGFIVYLENGAYIIEKIKRLLEEKLEKTGHKLMYFPLVATEELFSKEAEHIKGFSREVFKIEQREEKGAERILIVRPTSETIIYPMFKLWIRSHADLPLKIHQSVNVYRYETKATRPLYRVREIPWNEAHTAHESPSDAERQVKEAIEIYREVLEELGISFLLLKRPDFDKFAGAVYSIAFDAWNPDGRINQVGTVHNLGKNFSKAYDITFEKKDGSRGLVYQLCYGFGYSRVLAAIIAQHGDDRGLVLPPIVAPTQIVLIPILFKGQEKEVLEYSREIYAELKDIWRTTLDDREDITPGEKFYYWEMMGAPIRVEIGPREVLEGIVTLTRRDTLERLQCNRSEIVKEISQLMEKISQNLREKSKRMLYQMILDCRELEEAAKAVDNKNIVRAAWCGSMDCAQKIKEHVGGEIRGERYDVGEHPDRPCIACGQQAKTIIYIARAY
ncbi:MAG: proline--tRNA ligase [Aigarchaeota archaeon]|nr:proline--tRNA ligase [Aigarchaeota archaeon]MCX8192502.1 proline--tRNA ligase [Nitrososphaeria archaeon]MDW7985762.1 proline--tRNA ligase [Nitrososphaerota archaeon]